MSRKRGLGKGLDALISQNERHGPPRIMGEITQEVPIDHISPNPHQPRRRFDEEALAELAASIRVHGILQPLVLARATPDSPTPYYIVAGERRWRAAKLAGLTHVPAIIKDATRQQLVEWALVENVQRADLNPLEAAAAYKSLMEGFGLTQAEIAERVGKSRAAVANTLRLLNLPPDVQAALLEGTISEGHGRALLPLNDPALQKRVLDKIIREHLSVRQTEALVKKLLETRDSEAAPPPPPDPELRAIENAFRERLGTKVQVKKGKRGGQIVIHFYSDEELQALYEVIVEGGVES